MFKNLMKEIRYWGQVFLLPVYWFSFLTPRTRKIWLFGSTFGRRFADNPRYFYLYLNQCRRAEVRSIWITKEKEIVQLLRKHQLEAYTSHSLKGIWYCLRSSVYIFDNYSKDISFWLSGGALKINLWHGSGNKKTNYDNKFDRVRHPRNRRERFRFALRRLSDEKPYHYTLATSPMMADIFTSAFHTNLKHIIQEGYPRNDILFENGLSNVFTAKESETRKCMEQIRSKQSRILLYMPTFRSSESKFFEIMDLMAFNHFLTERNLVFFTKLHPKSGLKDEFRRAEYSNIKNIDAEVDPYTILKFANLLVTDYSSIYSDYLLLNRPSVLFPYDYEEYIRDTRECYFEYNEYMPEIKAYSMKELMDCIDLVLTEDTYEAGRINLRDKIFAAADGSSSERLFYIIRNIITTGSQGGSA